MIDSTNNSYKSILKATGVFGMLQVFKMIISIVTTKFVAVFIGPIGIGIVSLLTNSTNIIVAITDFEFLKIGTREIALNNNLDNKQNLHNSISLLHKIGIFIGLLGALLTIIFSRYLSFYTFGNYQKQHWFIILSVSLFITSISNVRKALLQGLNNIKTLVFFNIIVAFFSSIGSVLIYYYLRLEGIVWVLLYCSIILFIVSYYFTKHYTFKIKPLNIKEFYNDSSPIFKLGFFLSLNLIFGQICNFIIRLYLNNSGSSTVVLGYYEVSLVILGSYLGLIFNAMANDFFPKLTAISLDNLKIKNLVNNQIEIALILVTPAIVLLYFIAPTLIQILYSKAFLNSFTILKLALFSVILKAIVLPLAYIILAKGNKIQYFKQELFSDFINVSASIILYNFYGLTGLGIAFLVNYIVYAFYVYYIVNKSYNFTFSKSCVNLMIVNIIFGIISVVIIYTINNKFGYLSLFILFLASLYYSYYELNNRIDIKGFIKNKINKKRK